MAWGEDHRQLRIGLEQSGPGFEERGFLAFECAAGDDEAQIGGAGLEQAGCVGFFGGAHVELQIAGD